MGIDAMITTAMMMYLEDRVEEIALPVLTKMISNYLDKAVTLRQVAKAVKRNSHRLNIEKRRDGHYYISFRM